MYFVGRGGAKKSVFLEALFVREDRPRQWVVVFVDAQEPAEAHNSICNLAADFADHYAFNLSNVIAIQTIHRCPFHFVAADEIWKCERADAGNSGPVPAAPSEDSTMDMESSSRANMRVPVEQNRGNIFERSFDWSRPCLARAWLCLARAWL